MTYVRDTKIETERVVAETAIAMANFEIDHDRLATEAERRRIREECAVAVYLDAKYVEATV